MNKRQRKKKSKNSSVKPIPLKDLQKKTPKQLNQYKPERLRKTYQHLRAVANKRLKRLDEAGFFDQNIYKEYEFEFINPARDLDDVGIKEKLLQLRKFLSTEESTVRGQKKRQKAEEDFAEQLFNALYGDHDETDQEQDDKYQQHQDTNADQDQDETYHFKNTKRENVNSRADFIDITDPKQVKVFTEFIMTVKYNIGAEIFYDIRELYDLWNLWLDEGRPTGNFSKASRKFQQGLMKFASSQRTSVKSRTRRFNK